MTSNLYYILQLMSYGLVFVALNPACCVERFTIHCGLFIQLWQWSIYYIYHTHSCQPLLGVNLSPEFVNLYFPYACQGLLFFHWWRRHFEFLLAHVDGCFSDSFSVFLLSLKQQQNLMKIMFYCIPFPKWTYSPKIFLKKQQLYFVPINCMGWQVWYI